MFANSPFNPFESVTKALLDGAGKFTPDAAQGAAKDMMDNLRAWGDLVQTQAQAVQQSTMQLVDDMKSVREPIAAMEVFKANTQKAVALTAKHLQEATALSIEQFNSGVDLLQARHPAPEAFAPVAHGMKLAASAIESALLGALNSGVEATESVAAPKKSRAR
ncbi:MAG: hypothetical protein KA254_04065 [Rhodoferax sp.]|jgi:hypothetical protein|nr:hypothetical protein [Rhodoferax sp.]